MPCPFPFKFSVFKTFCATTRRGKHSLQILNSTVQMQAILISLLNYVARSKQPTPVPHLCSVVAQTQTPNCQSEMARQPKIWKI